MDSPFDSKHEDDQLAEIREREEEDVVRILSEKYGIAYADMSLKEIDADALRVIPEAEARAAEAVAFARAAENLSLAIHNPNNPALAKLKEELKERGLVLQEFLVSKKSLERVFVRYADLTFATESKPGVFIIPPALSSTISKGPEARGALKEKLDAAIALKSLERVSRVF